MIYQFQKSFFTENYLKFLKGTFAESYISSVTINDKELFLILYQDDGQVLKKTFLEFAADVEQIRPLFAELASGTISVCVDDNTYEMLIYMVASLLEAKTLCPISPLEGPERLQQKLKTLTSAYKVFVGNKYKPLLGKEQAAVMQRPTQDLKDFRVSMISKALPFHPDQPFIQIFTSGTTGASKIVCQSEVGVICNVEALIGRHSLKDKKAVGTCLPVYHVNALEFSFLTTLLSGSQFILFSKFSLPVMVRALDENKIDILSLVPSLLYAFNKAAHMIPPKSFSKTQYVVTAAAPLSAQIAKEFMSHFQCRVIQGYGLSEAVNFSLLTPVDLSEEEYHWSLFSEAMPSVGTALWGGDVYVLSPEGSVLGEGEQGEIALRGYNLMYGYLGEDQKKTFAGGYFRTGDLGFFKNNKKGMPFFFLTGRVKEIVKRHAVTVSLSDIEREISSVLDRQFEAIAVGFPNEKAGEEIAVVINFGSEEENLEPLLTHLRLKLPLHLRPRLFLLTQRSVRGPSGKSKRGDFLESLSRFKERSFGDIEVIERDEVGSLKD